MSEHELKCWPEFYQPVLDDEKPFEAREDDRDFQVGDVLWLREWDCKIYDDEVERVTGKRGIILMVSDSRRAVAITKAYTGRETKRKVTYKLKDTHWTKEGVAILGLERTDPYKAIAERLGEDLEGVLGLATSYGYTQFGISQDRAFEKIEKARTALADLKAMQEG